MLEREREKKNGEDATIEWSLCRMGGGDDGGWAIQDDIHATH